MKGKAHKTLYSICLIPFFIILHLYVNLWWLYLPFAILAFRVIDADEDTKNKGVKHRNWFDHSIIMPLTIFISIIIIPGNVLTPQTSILFLYPQIVHLLADVPTHKKKDGTWSTRRGTYLIRIKKGKRLSANQSSAWLIINSAIGVGVIFLCLI